MDKYYRTLNLRPGADIADIKKAFRKSVQKYHPDANGGVGNTEKFKEVVKAYHYLQKHYKVLGIQPVPSKKSMLAEWLRKMAERPANLKRRWSSAHARTAEPAQRRRPYEGSKVDHLVMQLPYEELKLRLTESNNEFVKKQSARALTQLYGSGVLPLLKKELKRATAPVCEEIIHCLGLIGTRDAVMTLEKCMRHSDVAIACAAIRALQHVNEEHARTLLAKMEKEGKALWLAVTHFTDTLKIRRIHKLGFIEKSELYIARAVRRSTRQPLPVVLHNLGWTIPE